MVRVLFLHPDLGIGGAERLVVDAALALQQKGHNISFLTNHYDSTHCFKETTDGKFLVNVVGDWLPRKIFGRFYAFCAYLRMLYAAFYASFYLARKENLDIVFCDQISIGIPILRLAKNRPKIIFYCHFPDQLLSAQEGVLKNIYRAPLNYLEELTVGMADMTLVNSKFTLRTFQETFRKLDILPNVLYPSLNTTFFDEMQTNINSQSDSDLLKFDNIPSNSYIFLDINRYERKKNHALALNAFKMLSDMLPANDWKRCRLIVAGGYDIRVLENVEHYKELECLIEKLNLKDNVILLRSPNDNKKFLLLHAAHCLLYTPANEHFGIVPLEGMYMAKPVIAVDSGGPTETIVHNSTGYLCEQKIDAFAKAMLELYKNNELRERMGVMGRKRVEQKFSFEAFAIKLNNIVMDLLKAKIEDINKKIK